LPPFEAGLERLFSLDPMIFTRVKNDYQRSF